MSGNGRRIAGIALTRALRPMAGRGRLVVMRMKAFCAAAPTVLMSTSFGLPTGIISHPGGCRFSDFASRVALTRQKWRNCHGTGFRNGRSVDARIGDCLVSGKGSYPQLSSGTLSHGECGSFRGRASGAHPAKIERFAQYCDQPVRSTASFGHAPAAGRSGSAASRTGHMTSVSSPVLPSMRAGRRWRRERIKGADVSCIAMTSFGRASLVGPGEPRGSCSERRRACPGTDREGDSAGRVDPGNIVKDQAGRHKAVGVKCARTQARGPLQSIKMAAGV